jgi:hypothetical protein
MIASSHHQRRRQRGHAHSAQKQPVHITPTAVLVTVRFTVMAAAAEDWRGGPW